MQSDWHVQKPTKRGSSNPEQAAHAVHVGGQGVCEPQGLAQLSLGLDVDTL